MAFFGGQQQDARQGDDMSTEQRIEAAKKILESMIEGCRNIKEERGIDEEVKILASVVIKDCNRTLAALNGKKFPGE